MLDDATCQRLAEELTLIPDCPRSAGATEALAKYVGQIFSDPGEATAIVEQACRDWRKWEGPAGLIDLLESSRQANPEFRDPSKPASCPLCEDERWIVVNGQAYRCRCAGGNPPAADQGTSSNTAQEQSSTPDPLTARTRPAPAPVQLKRITQADIDEVLRKRKPEKEPS
jgi:hypothetical protein